MRVFFFLMLALLVACNRTPVNERATNVSNQPAGETSAESPITLVEMDDEQLKELIARYRGRVVVVDVWATWCPPCVKEFPNLVALSKKYPKDKLACISLSCDHQGIDEFSEVRQQVLNFLTEHEATIDNVISTLETDQLFRRLGITSVPVVDVYAPDGTLHHRFDLSQGVEFTYADVNRLVQELVSQAGTSSPPS
jgi:thiol-disulfide isomerase/thioredoxin